VKNLKSLFCIHVFVWRYFCSQFFCVFPHWNAVLAVLVGELGVDSSAAGDASAAEAGAVELEPSEKSMQGTSADAQQESEGSSGVVRTAWYIACHRWFGLP